MRDNLPNMLRAAAKEWWKENKVVATGATRYDAALDEAADAIEELQGWNNTLSKSVAMLTKQIAELSKRVPKSGVWREEESGYDDIYYECSVCGAGICTIYGDPVDNAWSYCPECGAKLTGVERLPEPPKEE